MANILIIDDQQDRRLELVKLFKDLEHSPIEAWDGSNAAHKSDQMTYDVIIASTDITKVTIVPFLKALRAGKMNRITPVILYAEGFPEETVVALSKLSRLQFVNLPFDIEALTAKVSGVINAAAVLNRNQNVPKKIYTFSKASMDRCNKVPANTVDRDFFEFFPDMLTQIDSESIDFGIWIKGTMDLLEYVGPKFTGSENKKNVFDILAAMKKPNVEMGLYVRRDDKEKFFEHLHRRRISRIATKYLHDTHREAADLFNKLSMCATRFGAADVDQQIISSAEQISMDMMQRVGEKPELVGLLMDLLRKDPQMYDFIALMTVTAVSIGRKMGLKEPMLKKLSLGCFFHDVGMACLKLPLIIDREMTADEMAHFREHPNAGAEHLNLLEARGVIIPEEVFIIVMQHHERFNGTGFPNQKQGRMTKENPSGIHILASIVSVADRFAMYVLNESKNGTIDQNRILNALHRVTGEFDPTVLKACKDVFAVSRQGVVSWKATS